jgi:cytochrome c oxidase subunit 2
MTSRDVIHSFWAPNLSGKKDLIPGKATETWFQADTPGVYRAQCAEFCGHQHAKMALFVVAEPMDRFLAWLESQRHAATPPSDSTAKKGEQVFMAGSCALCHQISGTPAAAHLGPDLTHLASRLTIAAGTLPNTRDYRAGWIIDPQAIKPGTLMPATQLTPDELTALLAYLETLK